MTVNPDHFVPVATFAFPGEALIARNLLQSSDMVCYIENEHILTMVWAWNFAFGGFRLMVPASTEVEASELLSRPQLPEEASSRVTPEGRSQTGFILRLLFAFLILLTPNHPEYLRLIYASSVNAQALPLT